MQRNKTSAPKKEKTPLCDAQRGFRSLKIKKYIDVGLGILIGPLFPKLLFAIFLFNNKVSEQKCKDGILPKISFFSDCGWPADQTAIMGFIGVSVRPPGCGDPV